MRDRAQLALLPGEYRDAKQAERRRILEELLRHLARARARSEPWYIEALETARAFNRRPLRDREMPKPLQYDELPEGF